MYQFFSIQLLLELLFANKSLSPIKVVGRSLLSIYQPLIIENFGPVLHAMEASCVYHSMVGHVLNCQLIITQPNK